MLALLPSAFLAFHHFHSSLTPPLHCRYMRTECLNHRYVYGGPMQANRLVSDVADKHQRCTQTYVRRPYGVGLLVGSGTLITHPIIKPHFSPPLFPINHGLVSSQWMPLVLIYSRHGHPGTTSSTSLWPSVLAHSLRRLTSKSTLRSSLVLADESIFWSC